MKLAASVEKIEAFTLKIRLDDESPDRMDFWFEALLDCQEMKVLSVDGRYPGGRVLFEAESILSHVERTQAGWQVIFTDGKHPEMRYFVTIQEEPQLKAKAVGAHPPALPGPSGSWPQADGLS